MSDWRPEHAAQLLTAHDVLRAGRGDLAPADLLYQRWYAARPPHVATRGRWDSPVATTARAAHGGAHDWAGDDCEVLATGIAGVVVVGTPRGRRALCRGEYVTTSGRPGFPPRVGDRVRPVARVGAVVQEGWWRTWGTGWDTQHQPGPLVRTYLRPAPGAVAGLVNAVTSALRTPDAWLLKVASTTDGLSRPDAVVVYLAGPAREQERDLVATAAAGLAAGPPPPLTEPLGDGIGWAEDPGTGESFGEVRCAAVAAAYAGLSGSPVSGDQWLDVVADEFRCRGMDPAAPHRSGTTVGAA